MASYSAVQLTSTLAGTRTLGYRGPASALLTGAAINAITHIKHTTVVRKAGGEGTEYSKTVQDVSGPGTALMELDLLCTNSEGAR
ncbi:hypothetical protein OHB07_39220 (plasmid) [Streptomyces sp. NBC_00111]|uniref:hypothetical protein n=1 Tax=Streptomyces sp. NBC_00111 TaxID=2975655 RepID=UPI002F914251